MQRSSAKLIDKEKDKETGLSNFGVRNYSDELGRFMSVDDWWEKYRSWSPYHYSFNNPLTLKDPSGLGAPSDLSRFQPAWTNDISSGFVGGAGVSGGQILGRLINLVLDAVALNALVEDGAQKVEEKVEEKAQEKESEKKEKRAFSKKDREEGYEKSKDADGKPKCEYCGEQLKKEKGSDNSYEADHKQPYAKGGKSTQENLAPSCRDCNRSKGSETVEEWQKWQENQRTFNSQ